MNALLLAALLAGEIDVQALHAAVARERPKVVLLSFWASWCAPCLVEFPHLIALAREHPNLVVISVSIDDPGDRPAVETIVAKEKPPFPVYLKARGPDEAFINGVDPEWSGAVPFTLLFDEKGKVAARLEGEQTREDFERALAALRRTTSVADELELRWTGLNGQ